MSKQEVAMITIPKPDFKWFDVPIVGTTGLISHKWSEKAKKEMLLKQQLQKVPKTAKDPVADYLASMYVFNGDTMFEVKDAAELDGDGIWYAFPAVAFKNAAVRAAQQFDIPMTTARQLFWVYGLENTDYVKIEGSPEMREDMVRLNGKTADLRYRAEYNPWSTVLRVKVNAQIVAPETVFNLIAQAGFSVGVGEWRPEKNGQYGCFEVANV